MSKIVHEIMLHDGNAFGWDHQQMTKVVRLDDLRLPIHICLGRYEAATQEELDEMIADLTHERSRR